ncbi:MAG TPA: dipeptide epimerase [Polyangiaceae bacterium]|nr:dipeptide epimerase [Polyangiaceae bacterium]
MPRITDLTFSAFDVALREPFGIATGTQHIAQNVLVRLVLEDGSEGLGEAAPFPAVNGETQAAVLAALPDAKLAITGQPAERYRVVAHALREVLQEVPSARAAVETALLDALCKSAGISLWKFFGGAETSLMTDVTVPTGDPARAKHAAERAARDGFRTLKVKVGGSPLEVDLERLALVHQAAPNAELVLDANGSLNADTALELIERMGAAREQLVLFEQPTAAEDWDGLDAVGRNGHVPVAADESVRSAGDVARLAAARVVSVVNIKITKSGIMEAWDMIATARAHGLGLMVGGMVETELAMTTSACLAAGIGGFRFVDLDTPLFMAERPLEGGFRQVGPHLALNEIALGHGVRYSAAR